MMLRLIRSGALVCACVALFLAPPARAQEAATWFALELTDPAELLAHPKDAGLREALRFVPERLAEVVAMTGGGAEFEQMRPLLPLLGAPMRIAVVGAPPAQPNGPPRISVVAMSMQERRDDAEGIVATLTGFLDMQGMIEPDEFGLGVQRLRTPLGEGSLEVLELDGGFAAALRIGEFDADPFAVLPRAEGDAIMRMRLDLEAMAWFTTPLVQNLMQMAGPNAAALSGLGRLVGEQAPVIEFTMSRVGDGLQAQSRTTKMRPNAAAYWIPESGLSDADLRAIPANASMGGMSGFDLAGFWDATVGAMPLPPEATEFFDETREITGLDLGGDVIPALGPGFGFYSSLAGISDATPTAFTVVMSVRDRAVIQQFLDRVAQHMNEEMEQPTDELQGLARLTISAADEAGARWWVFETPGLPVPFLPTVALTDQHLILCFSKTAARGAVAQATGRGDAGIGSRPEVRRLAAGQAPLQVFYMDIPALAPMAYPYVDWLVTALANGVNSPDAQRGPKLPAIPPYDEWKTGIRPLTSVAIWDGDAMVQKAEMDGSLLTTMSGGAIGVAQSGGGVALLAGILVPALERARSSAMELHEGAQLRLLHTACITWATDHGGRFPDDLSQLVEAGLIDPEDLESPYGPVWDGGPDYFLKPGASDSLDAGELQLYSRAQMATEGRTAVAFGDNYVMTVSMDEFFEIISEDANSGVEWNVP